MTMLNLNDREWRPFFLTEVFPIIQRGKRLKSEDHVPGRMPYVSSSAMNNGVDNFVSNTQKVRIFSNCLSLANSGSVGSSFYEPFAFVASDHVTHLKNEQYNKYHYLFIAALTSRLSKKYNFNREINDNRISREKIMLPVDESGKPDLDFMEAYCKEREQQLIQKYKVFIGKLHNLGGVIQPLDSAKWKGYYIDDIFTIRAGKRLTKADMDCGSIPFIGATDSNNGITSWIATPNSSFDRNVLGVNYNGSVVENFYHVYGCVFSDDVKRLHLRNHADNKFILLFCKVAILQQKEKYTYGYKFNGHRMERQKILLPVNEHGHPNYNYMERYGRKIMVQMYQRYTDYLTTR